MDLPGCSAASLEAGETLAATALESVDRWLLLEVTEPWAPKPLESEVFSEPLRARIRQWLETPRSRLQLIRRPGRSGKRPLVMIVNSARGRRAAAKLEIERYDDLLGVDLEAIDSGPIDPLCLVCAHGRRDRCCGVLGSAVFRAAQAEQVDVWQTSHLGGHRFAACALWLPNGTMHGRLRPEHVPAFIAAQQAAEVGDFELFRGTCAYDRPTQAAAIHLRRRLGEASIDGLEWQGTTVQTESSWEARFRAGNDDHLVRVHLEDTGVARPPSCNTPPEPVQRFVER